MPSDERTHPSKARETMARPLRKHGYVPIAHELHAAIACADFTKGASIVLREVLNQLFRKVPLKTALVSPSDLAKRTGWKKQFFIRGINELVASGVITRADEGGYLFVKDYASWTRNGEPRLTDEELDYAFSSRPATAENVAFMGGNPVTLAINPVTRDEQSSYPGEAIQLPKPTNLVTHEVVPPRPPIEERGRDQESKKDSGPLATA